MKILHVETGRHLYGGAQQVLYLAEGLEKTGIDNIIVCPPGSGLDRAARDADIRVTNLKCAGDHDLGFAFRLRQLVLSDKPDIVHCHSRRGGDFLGGLAVTGTSIPAIVSRRVDNPEPRLIAALRYRPFDKVVAISGAIAAVLREAGVDDRRLTVIRDAVDTDYFSTEGDRAAFRTEFSLHEDDIVIAVIAQLIPRKGHRYLLEALARIKAGHPELKLIVFGQGPLETELRERTARLGLGGTVQFAGFRDDLDSYMSCIDVLAHPALAEGLGVATLKAAAAGVPVVGFAAGGVIESVADGKTGLLVSPMDTDALANAIARLVDDPAMRQQLGDAGRARMQSDFPISAMVEDYARLYEEILNGRS
jgi:glycosyltransferase involved in cell wall biosynthesis